MHMHILLIVKDHVTQYFMVLYHKYDTQIKIYQYCMFQKALFIKVLPNFTLHANKGRKLEIYFL
jgi:hypothetical protein